MSGQNLERQGGRPALDSMEVKPLILMDRRPSLTCPRATHPLRRPRSQGSLWGGHLCSTGDTYMILFTLDQKKRPGHPTKRLDLARKLCRRGKARILGGGASG